MGVSAASAGAGRRFESRPGRAALVAPTLAELRGPTGGVVELPHRLMWQADRHLDLDDSYERRWLYEIVLREAIRLDELSTWLDGPTLCQLWPDLILPRGVRQAWEEQHPALRQLRRAA